MFGGGSSRCGIGSIPRRHALTAHQCRLPCVHGIHKCLIIVICIIHVAADVVPMPYHPLPWPHPPATATSSSAVAGALGWRGGT